MKNKHGNIEIEDSHYWGSNEVFIISLGKESEKISLSVADARSLRDLLTWALDGCGYIGCVILGRHNHIDHAHLGEEDAAQ